MSDQKRLRCLTCGWERLWAPIPDVCPQCGGTKWRDVVPRAAMVCDFCSDPDIMWDYEVPDTNLVETIREVPNVEGGTTNELFTHDSMGGWAVCAKCAELVEKKKWDRLARRIQRTFEHLHGKLDVPIESVGPGGTGEKFPTGDFAFRVMVDRFKDNYTGKRRKFRKRKTIMDELPPEMSTAMWSRALNAQMTLAEFWQSEWGERVAYGYMESLARSEKVPDWALKQRVEIMTETAKKFGIMTSTSDAYFISRDMVDLLEVAAPSMPDQKLYISDLPSSHGFVYLDRSHSIIDQHGMRLSFRAFAWAPLYDPQGQLRGVGLIGYSDMTDREAMDDYFKQGMHDFDQYGPGVKQYMIGHYDEWDFGDGNMGVAFRQFLAAFWTLSQQPLAVRVRRDADRATRRRFSRLAQEQNVKPVTVVTLRRKKPVAEEGEPDWKIVDWSHRWYSRGHWGHRHAKEGLRLVWVTGSIKGPEDKPFIEKKRVFQWTR